MTLRHKRAPQRHSMSPLGHDEAAGRERHAHTFLATAAVSLCWPRETEAPDEPTNSAGGPGRRSKYGRGRPGRASDTIVKSDASMLAHGVFPEA